MKKFRIAWFAVVEDDSVLEGRSLVQGETQQEAIEEFYTSKMQEYRLKPGMINISSVIELPK